MVQPLHFFCANTEFLLEDHICLINEQGSLGKSHCLSVIFSFSDIFNIEIDTIKVTDMSERTLTLHMATDLSALEDKLEYIHSSGEMSVVFVDEESLERTKVFDKEFKKLKKKIIFKETIETNLYLVVISRGPVASRLSSTHLSSYVFSKDGNKSKVSRLNYPLPGKKVNLNDFELLIIEDSKSGFYYFDELCEYVKVLYGDGKDNLLNVIQEQSCDTKIGVVFDYLGISHTLIELLKEVELSANLTLLPISCLEGMFLESSHFNKQELIKTLLHSQIYNKEKAALDELKKVLTPLQLSYNKSGDSYKMFLDVDDYNPLSIIGIRTFFDAYFTTSSKFELDTMDLF